MIVVFFFFSFFVGYVFGSASAILPFLEHPQTGITSQFCASIAQRLRCHVAAGYPERLEPQEVGTRALEDGSVVDVVGANSAVVYGPDGTSVGHYRKSHLFRMDKPWAKPGKSSINLMERASFLISKNPSNQRRSGPGFATFHLPPPLNTVTLGICMDLNPKSPSWTFDGGPYELADHCLKTESGLLVLLNAWLDSEEEKDMEEDISTMNYWATLLRPLWYRMGNNGEDAESQNTSEDSETIVVVCNRSGTENGAHSLYSRSRECAERG